MKNIILIFSILLSFFAFSQNIKSPDDFLGYPLGTEFTRHSDVVAYMNHLADKSPMIIYETYGKTNERRTLSYAIISSENNIKNIDKIRTDNLKQTGLLQGDANPEIAIVWMSYNVHGNEASSTEAAIKTIYTLITEKKAWLENTVVIIDPSANPDGRDRYVNWYNQNKATPYNALREATEHNEPWPGGRPNHYLFDLNRDWFWASQVESQQRIKIYNQWMPHIHVDYHEQGINNPYYFAPGAEPYHELITDWQRSFQTEIGKNHAKYFDKEGWLYFTREYFDLLYPSYGDTYPTYMGAIGMTYEKAGHGLAGLGIHTDEGYELTLIDRVEHHYTTGLSTVEIASQNATKLNQEFKKYFNHSGLKHKSFAFTGNQDNIKTLAKLLDLHEIKYGYNNSGAKANGFNYATNSNGSIDLKNALVVSTNQPKGKMVQILFEPETKLSTPLTYDITAWNLAHAYGLQGIASTTLISANTQTNLLIINNIPNPNAAGYISKWNSMEDARFLSELLKNEIKVRFSEKDFVINGQKFDRGSLVITKSDNKNMPDYNEKVTSIANNLQRQLYASPTGFSDNGTDFGSSSMKLIHPPKIAVLKGRGTSSLNYGAIWHFFEQQLHYPISSIDTQSFSRLNLDNYSVLVLPSGYYYQTIDDDNLKKIKNWVRSGGTLIAFDNALNSFVDAEGFGLKLNDTEDTNPDEDNNNALIPYDQRETESIKDFVTGTIFKTKVDTSHPLGFGYNQDYFTLKTGNTSYSFLKDGYNVVYMEGDAQRMSGFAGKNAIQNLKNSLVIGHQNMGRGHLVYLVDDVMFRSFWENGKLFFVNSVFFLQKATYSL